MAEDTERKKYGAKKKRIVNVKDKTRSQEKK